MDRQIAGAINGTVIQNIPYLFGKVIRPYDPNFYKKKHEKR